MTSAKIPLFGASAMVLSGGSMDGKRPIGITRAAAHPLRSHTRASTTSRRTVDTSSLAPSLEVLTHREVVAATSRRRQCRRHQADGHAKHCHPTKLHPATDPHRLNDLTQLRHEQKLSSRSRFHPPEPGERREQCCPE